MGNYIKIFKDSNTEIKICKDYHTLLRLCCIRRNRLQRFQTDWLLRKSFDKAKEKGYTVQGMSVKFSGDSYIIVPERAITESCLLEPFKIFSHAFEALSINGRSEETKDLIEGYYKDMNIDFFIELYPEDINGVSGYLFHNKDKDITIIPFTFENLNFFEEID